MMTVSRTGSRTNRSAWAAIARQPSFAGGFLWSGFDYRGEPTPYGWPAASSYFGCMDLCGFPKTGFYIRQALWIHDRPVLTLVPHWNWAGKEGQPIKVMALDQCRHGGAVAQWQVDRGKESRSILRWSIGRCPMRRASWKPWPRRTAGK